MRDARLRPPPEDGMAGNQSYDLYKYMAFGGTAPTYDVTMTQEVDDEVMDVARHQFMITMNMMGVPQLSGQPNTAAGIYNWILNARDSASDQHVYQSWKLRVVPETVRRHRVYESHCRGRYPDSNGS